MINSFPAGKLLQALFTFLCILLLISCQSSEEEAKDHLQRGKELLEKGDYAAAKLELKNAGQADQNISDTYYYMALLDEKNRNYKSMRENLKKTLKLDPDNIDARIKLGKVLLLYNDVDGALLQAGNIIDIEAKNQDAQLLKASALIRQKKNDEALLIIDDVLAVDQQNTEALSLKVRVFMGQEEFDSALSFIDQAIQAEPDNASLYLLKVQLNAKRKDMDAVVRDYEKVVKLSPDRLDYAYNLAGLYVQNKRPEDAENLLIKLVADNPKNQRTKFALLTFLKSQNKPKAEIQLQEYLQYYRDEPKVLFQFSRWMIASGDFDKAQATLKQIVEQEADSQLGLSAQILLAKLAFQQNDQDSALKIVNKIIKDRPEYQDAKLLKARIVLSQGDPDKSIALLKSVLLLNPNSDEALVMLAQAYNLKGEKKQAKKSFRRAFEINPGNLSAVMAEYNRAMAKENLKNAENILEKAIRRHPDNLALLNKLAQVRIAQKNWDGALEAIASINSKRNGKVLANFLQGKVYQNQGSYKEAIEIYKGILKSAPNNAGALNGMAACYEGLNNRQAMLDYLSLFIQDNPQMISAYILKSRLLQLENSFPDAISVIKKAISDDVTNVQAYAQLANIYIAMGDKQKTLTTYQDGLKEVPNSIRLSLLLASFYERSGDYGKAVTIYEELIENNPKLDIAASNLATILIDNYGDEESLERARLLTARFKSSEQPFFSDTYAWAELKSGNVKDVLKIFKRNVLLVPDLPVFKYHLGVAYFQVGNNGAATAELNQAINLAATHEFTEIASARQLMEEIKKAR